jgi:hypothetical protein
MDYLFKYYNDQQQTIVQIAFTTNEQNRPRSRTGKVFCSLLFVNCSRTEGGNREENVHSMFMYIVHEQGVFVHCLFTNCANFC